MATNVSFGVLGPVEAWADGRRLPLGPPQQRTVLAVILLNDGGVTSPDELVEALWADEPPAGAVKTVRTYVSRLRAVLDPAGAVTESMAGGYRLRVGSECFDLARFVELTAQLPSVNPAAERAERARLALRIFRGEPLAGLNGVWAETQRARFSYLKAATYEALYVAELEAGHYAQAIAELPAVIRQFPFRERLRELQIRALYQAELRAEAFAAYRGVQQVLREELGIEPMPALQELHRRMLQGDPALSPPRQSSGTSVLLAESAGHLRTGVHGALVLRDEEDEPDCRIQPAQLPAGPAGFTGRDSEVRRADGLLAAAGPGPAVVVITGMGGVGKTSLALHWAHRLASRYADGQLYEDLRGYGPDREPLSAADVLAGFLQALGVTAGDVPSELTARAGMFRSLMTSRRMVILLDNAAAAGQVVDLLPGAGDSLVIVTSRGTLPDLVVRTGAQLLTLRPPEHQDALALFAARVGPERVRGEPVAARDIVELSGRLPLALAVAAARAAAEIQLPLSAIAAELSAAHGTLSAFRRPDATFDVGAVLSWSYRALGDRSAEVFRLLCLHPGPDLNAELAASMVARPVAETRELIAELVAAAMLTEHRPGRWVMHDLVRAYGQDLLLELDNSDERRLSLHRMLDYYLYAGRNADSQLFKRLQPIEPEQPAPGVVDTEAEPAAWFGDEHPALLCALELAVREGFHRHAWQLSWVVRDYLNRQGLWHHLQTSQQAGHAAAVRSGEPAVQARALWGLALADTTMGRNADALTRLRGALDIFERIGDAQAADQTTIWMTGVFDKQGDWLSILEVSRPLLARYPPGTDRTQRARLLITMSWANAHLGRYAEAITDALEVIGMADHLHPFRVADTWDTLGYARAGLGEIDQAASSYHRAVDLYRRHGAPVCAAESLRRLGDMFAQDGRDAQAAETYRQALALVADIAGPRGAQLSVELGRILSRVHES